MASPETMSAPQGPEPDLDKETFDAMFDNPVSTSELPETHPDYSPDQTADNESTPDTEPARADAYTNTAARLRNSTERVAALLESWSAGREARADKREQAIATVRGFGVRGLRAAGQAGVVALGVTILTAERVTETGAQIRTKITMIAIEARQRINDRRARIENQRQAVANQNEAFASYEPNIQYTQAHEEANEMNRQKKADQEYADISYGPNIRYSQDHIEANRMNEEKKVDQQNAYDSYADNIQYSQDHIEANQMNQNYAEHSEALEDNEEFDIQQRRQAALARREARRARRRELYGAARERGSKAYAGAKKYGRLALKFIKRTAGAGAAAARAAATAGAQAWNASR
jgi:hypothetical protein